MRIRVGERVDIDLRKEQRRLAIRGGVGKQQILAVHAASSVPIQSIPTSSQKRSRKSRLKKK